MSAVAVDMFAWRREEYLTANFQRAAREILANRSPALMEVPDLSLTNIEGAWAGLKRFDTEVSRDDQKLWEIHVPRDPKFDEPDDGAIRKEPPSDWKLFFHYRPDLEQLLRDERGIVLWAWQKDWFMHMRQIWHVCSMAHRTYAAELDRLQPGYRFEERAHIWTHLNCLRLLRYVPHAGTLAKWHTDRSATTFHVAETLPGFRVRHGFAIEPQESPVAPNVLVFNGDQLRDITDHAVPPLSHAVIDTTSGVEERFAMVFFGKMFTGTL